MPKNEKLIDDGKNIFPFNFKPVKIHLNTEDKIQRAKILKT